MNMDNYYFSTILYVDQDNLFFDTLHKLSESAQQIDDKTEFIVIDPFSQPHIEKECYTIPNVVYCKENDISLPAAYNKGLELATGKYINFCLASSYYSSTVYADVKKLFSQNQKRKLISCTPLFAAEPTTTVNYAASFLVVNPEDSEVDLNKTPIHNQLMLQAYFMDQSLLTGKKFDESLHETACIKMVLDILLECPSFYCIKNTVYYYRVPSEDNFSLNSLQYNQWWYTDELNNFMLPFLQKTKDRLGEIPTYIQNAFLYLLLVKFDCNSDDRSKGVLKNVEQVQEFVHAVLKTTLYIDNEVIGKPSITGFYQSNRSIRSFLLKNKLEIQEKKWDVINNFDRFMVVTSFEKDKEDAKNNVVILGNPKNEYFRIRLINYQKGKICIEANIGLADFLASDEYSVYAIAEDMNGKNRKKITAQNMDIYPLKKYFGYTFQRKNPVYLEIPVKKIDQRIQFFYNFKGTEIQFKLVFDTYNSRLFSESKYSYWMFAPSKMLTWDGKNKLYLCNCSKAFQLKREYQYCKSLRKQITNKEIIQQGLKIRFEYWRQKATFTKKRIWVTFDKMYKAGDNGEYMYQYLRKEQKDIDIYYIIRKDAPDFDRLIKEDPKHILVYGSLKATIYCLLAEVILDTHANIFAQIEPSPDLLPFTKDLLSGDIICIQHGLTMQNIAQFQNRQFDNIKLYCCASKYEIQNMSHPIYGYNPEQFRLVGMARYDGLVNKDQKIILITPSWRKNVVNSSVANVKRTHNNNFINSVYYKIYNSLINDEKLINYAKEYGYRIIYLLHPAMSPQINDFEKNDYVEILASTDNVSYEKILCESSLMVTDYSGVQYDFAYMRKPVVYYHPSSLPPHYEKGMMNYQTMGFGPICTEHDELITCLCKYMENNCQLEPEFKERADNFFAFDDHDNCHRIYESICEWLKNK